MPNWRPYKVQHQFQSLDFHLVILPVPEITRVRVDGLRLDIGRQNGNEQRSKNCWMSA